VESGLLKIFSPVHPANDRYADKKLFKPVLSLLRPVIVSICEAMGYQFGNRFLTSHVQFLSSFKFFPIFFPKYSRGFFRSYL